MEVAIKSFCPFQTVSGHGTIVWFDGSQWVLAILFLSKMFKGRLTISFFKWFAYFVSEVLLFKSAYIICFFLFVVLFFDAM